MRLAKAIAIGLLTVVLTAGCSEELPAPQLDSRGYTVPGTKVKLGEFLTLPMDDAVFKVAVTEIVPGTPEERTFLNGEWVIPNYIYSDLILVSGDPTYVRFTYFSLPGGNDVIPGVLQFGDTDKCRGTLFPQGALPGSGVKSCTIMYTGDNGAVVDRIIFQDYLDYASWDGTEVSWLTPEAE